jgi:hypothetical protein
MANMSYCRFRNTYEALSDCVNNLRTLSPSDFSGNTESERDARAGIILLAAELLCEIGIDDPCDTTAVRIAIMDLNAEEIPGDDEDE